MGRGVDSRAVAAPFPVQPLKPAVPCGAHSFALARLQHFSFQECASTFGRSFDGRSSHEGVPSFRCAGGGHRAHLERGGRGGGEEASSGGRQDGSCRKRRPRRLRGRRGSVRGAGRSRGEGAAQRPRPGGPANARFAELPRIADSKKDALADKKRDEAIEGFKRLIPKIQDGTSRKADLLYRLSELYWEKSKYLYRLEMDRFLEAEKKYDAAVARGEKLEAPKQDHRESERYRAEVMSLYEDILRDYPQYEIRDEVLFSQGYNLYELGRQPEAVKRYEELIRDFPKSQFVPDAYIQLGNHYFDNNKLIPAKQNYEKARDTGVPKIYAYAIYKLAWCDYNAGDYEAGLKKLQEAVEYAETRGEELGDLKTEALNDLTVFYVQLDQPKEAIAYFKAKAPEKRQSRLIAKTAVGLADAGHFDSGILHVPLAHRRQAHGPQRARVPAGHRPLLSRGCASARRSAAR